MDISVEISLKSICCTCLSVDRKLTKLCRVDNGVNNLFYLLSSDAEAYNTIFQRGASHLYMCWECEAVIRRLCMFRKQVSAAHKVLSDIVDGKCCNLSNIKPLSRLKKHYTCESETYIENQHMDSFIDCGLIKSDNDSDVPLNIIRTDLNITTDYKNNELSETSEIENEGTLIYNEGDEDKVHEKRKTKKYKIIKLTEKEYLDRMEKRREEEDFVNAKFKCELCVIFFKDGNEMQQHNSNLHTQKPKYIKCDVCCVFVRKKTLLSHKRTHLFLYQCKKCWNTFNNYVDIKQHMKSHHVYGDVRIKIEEDNTDCKSISGYPCPECNKVFKNKNCRYKHMKRMHSPGLPCSLCGKLFPFKHHLRRHEMTHSGNTPREQCPTCGKMVRTDLLKVHSRIHSERKSYECIACDKRFVSLGSYEYHLKYTATHAIHDILKYKCTMCPKGYRSRAELQDHVNYQHMGKTQHKCPICDKALATPRCITRHVKRAHEGIKENTKDKICQVCGKAFRNKRCLREHELIHSGERPLSCNICGRTFRQSASLYTHKRRVHNVPLKLRVIEHTGTIDSDTRKKD